MTTLVLKNGNIVTSGDADRGDLWLCGDRIKGLGSFEDSGDEKPEIIDVTGFYVTAGLFDLQVNGSDQCNLWNDPGPSELEGLRRELALAGVTSFLPTLITDEIGHMVKNRDFLLSAGAGCLDTGAELARMPGIHLEGPFLSPARPGVHPPNHIIRPSAASLDTLVIKGVRLVTMAPEEDNELEAVKTLVGRGVRVSLGHSDAGYDQALQAFEAGVGLMTHTFNALPPVHHRKPGAVGAALLDGRVSCCLIADGLHVAPPVLKMVLSLKGADKVILASDKATTGTKEGGLVGSSITVADAVKNMVDWNICSFEEAVRMATCNPASALGLDAEIGDLRPGLRADVLVWQKDPLMLKYVILAGCLIKGA